MRNVIAGLELLTRRRANRSVSVFPKREGGRSVTELSCPRPLGEPIDVASLLFWLLQPENNRVTGQLFGVDGGLGTLYVTGR